jgi:myo-inositol-1(or 4)-monophosphatase
MDFSIGDAMRVATVAAHSAGKILREMLETAEVREKAPKDLVTDADIAAQNEIEKQIMSAFPSHRFIGEESSGNLQLSLETSDTEWRWLVDPLDGTANYAHRLPNFAVSIALMQGSRIALGVVFDPMADEIYTAVHGDGARVNDRPIHASQCTQLDQALVAASFPPQVRKDSIEIQQFIEVLVRSQSVRRLGSAALNLCFVAHGRLDAYWANQLKTWDMAAGVLIAREAGACVSKPNGQAFDPWHGEVLATATPSLNRELQQCLGTSRNAQLPI